MIERDAYRHTIRDVMTQLARGPVTDAESRLSAVTSGAVRLIRGAEWADVMVVEADRFRSLAPTATVMTELDAVQMRHRRGPCLEVGVNGGIIRSSDLTTERRWPEFRAAARAAGVGSVLTFQLFTGAHGMGALNVFARSVGSFTIDDEALGSVLAAHAAIALTANDGRRLGDGTQPDGRPARTGPPEAR